MDYGIETQCIYGNGEQFEGDRTGAFSFPIYPATQTHADVLEEDLIADLRQAFR